MHPHGNETSVCKVVASTIKLNQIMQILNKTYQLNGHNNISADVLRSYVKSFWHDVFMPLHSSNSNIKIKDMEKIVKINSDKELIDNEYLPLNVNLVDYGCSIKPYLNSINSTYTKLIKQYKEVL